MKAKFSRAVILEGTATYCVSVDERSPFVPASRQQAASSELRTRGMVAAGLCATAL